MNEDQNPEPASFNDKCYYFLSGMTAATLKTLYYGFTIPSSIRKTFSHSHKYRSHIDSLEKEINETCKDPQLKKYVELGDLLGFWAVAPATTIYYATKAQEDPKLLGIWIFSNLVSLSYESFMAGYNTFKAINKTNRK